MHCAAEHAQNALSRGAALLLGLWIALAPLGCVTQALPRPANPAIVRLETDLTRRVNALRVEHGLRSLRPNRALARIARLHSVDMAAHGYLAHRTPEGVDPVARIRRAGLHGLALVGENVGLTSRPHPNAEILRAWLASPEHRANLLAPAFDASGIGIARSADGTYYYTQDFVGFRNAAHRTPKRPQGK